jgi:FG-GAP-like repeat
MSTPSGMRSLVALVLGVTLLTPVGAGAEGPAFRAGPGRGPTGTVITTSGDGCAPPAVAVVVRLVAGHEVPTFDSFLVDGDGTWSGDLVVPAGTPARTYRLEAHCDVPGDQPAEEDADLVTYAARSFTVTGEGAGAESVPPEPRFSGGIEPFPDYDGQSTCSPSPKPGTVAFMNMVMTHFGGSSLGISRACTIGGTSEHKEGRAWDWSNNAGRAADRARVQRVFTWLFATDAHCNRYANARRLGIMYVIWNRQFFGLYDTEEGWRPYTGSSPHTDHVHFSLTRDGAYQRTSWWNPVWPVPTGWDVADHADDTLEPADGQPLVGDFDGNGVDDLLWYQPGTAPDEIWWGEEGGGVDVAPVTINGTYEPFVGDFNGDCRADVFWYGPGPAADREWFGHRNRLFSGTDIVVDEDYDIPVVGDFNGDRSDDILWYGVGARPDALWRGSIYGFGRGSITVNGTFQPLAGDFDGNRKDDVFFYGPGTDRDVVWYGNLAGFAGREVTFDGVASPPIVGDLNGDQRTDVLWYVPGVGSDRLWVGAPNRAFVGSFVDVDEDAPEPLTGDFDGDGRDDILFHGGAETDPVWWL